MRNLSDTVDINSNTTKTDDDLSLEVKVKYNNTYLKWSNTLNGVGYSRLSLKFDKWDLSKYYDDRSFYKLGSSEVNISQEEAHNIALESVKSYQYTSEDEEKANFNILEELIYSRFDFLNRTDRFVKYPIWIVDLPFDRVYAGGASYIEVMLWADSGEVISIEALGSGFPYDSDSTPIPSSSPIPTSTATPSSKPVEFAEPFPTTLVVTVSLLSVAIAGIGLLVYFKKRKH